MIATLTAPASSAPGQPITLSWGSSDATRIQFNVTGDGAIGTTEAPNGSVTVNPAFTTTYEIIATGPSGEARASVTVNIEGPTPQPAPPPPPPPDPGAPPPPYPWQIGVEAGTGMHGVMGPVKLGSGWVWAFEFPTNPAASMHAVWLPFPSLVGKSQIRLRAKIVNRGALRPNECTNPTISLYLEHIANVWDWQPHRFYGGTTDLIHEVDDEFVIIVPLQPNLWPSVNGQPNAGAFADCLSKLKRIGFVFGGIDRNTGCQNNAHGVYALQPGVFFYLMDYVVE